MNRLKFRRQFAIGSTPFHGFDQWNKAVISNRYYLTVHPDLELTQIRLEGRELILIGYIIDPFHPKWGNSQILSNLLQKSKNKEMLFKEIESLSGRWVLIFNSGDEIILFNDPCGLRSVFYTDRHNKEFYCASQPGLFSVLFGIDPYGNETKHFIESEYYKSEKEYWWPSGSSLYKDVKSLVPNHYLDLDKIQTKRYWPQNAIFSTDYNESVSRVADLLKRLMNTAGLRYKLAFPITAGIDTRVLLAASKDIREDLYFYTLMYDGLNLKSSDVHIPQKLLNSIGLDHHILDCTAEMDNEFKTVYNGNVDMSHSYWGDIAFGLNRQYPQDRICVKGNCAEIARCFYYKNCYPQDISGSVLARLAGMGNNNFAIQGFDHWFEEAIDVSNDCKIDILDLFYWEHRIGSWQAMSQLEWDIVMETYTPYNCRELLISLLSVDKKYRAPPRYRFFENIIETMWQELLREPINPKLFKYTLRPLAKKVMKLTGTYNLFEKILNKK